VGRPRPAELDPLRRRVGGLGDEDANLPDFLERLTADVAGLRMVDIPIGLQGYTVDVSQRMRRALRRVVAMLLCYREHHPPRDDLSD
jgi:hypothetical protein